MSADLAVKGKMTSDKMSLVSLKCGNSVVVDCSLPGDANVCPTVVGQRLA